MPKTTDLPKTADALQKEADKVRKELADARRDHALQKLDSTAKLRKLRVRLAQVLTMQSKLTKEQK